MVAPNAYSSHLGFVAGECRALSTISDTCFRAFRFARRRRDGYRGGEIFLGIPSSAGSRRASACTSCYGRTCTSGTGCPCGSRRNGGSCRGRSHRLQENNRDGDARAEEKSLHDRQRMGAAPQRRSRFHEEDLLRSRLPAKRERRLSRRSRSRSLAVGHHFQRQALR